MSLTIARTTVTTWRSLPRDVWLLVAARAVNRLGAFTLPFLSVVLVAEVGASVVQAGYLVAAFGLATIPSRLLGGRLADAWGTRTTIVVGLVATAVAQVCVAVSTTLPAAVASVVLLGLAFELYEPPSQALVADVVPAADRPVAFGLLAAALAAAGMAAGLLAAVLADVGLRWLFVADAATCVACAVVIRWGLPARARRTPTAAATRSTTLAVRGASPWRDRRLLALLGLGTLFAVVYLQVTIALPLTVTGRGLPASVVGLLLAVSAATIVLGQPVLTVPWLRRRDDVGAMAVGYVVLAAGLLLTGLATGLAAYVLATVVWSLGDLVLMGRACTLVAAIAPEGGRGSYLAAYGTSWGVAAVVAPLVGTQLLDRSGVPVTWAAMAGLCLVLAAACGRARGLLGGAVPGRADG